MPITSPVVLGIIAALAVLIPVLLVITWRRRPRGVGGALLRLVAILCCQVLALTAGILAANRTYDFYSSWGDLFSSLGQQGGDDDDQSGLPSSGSDGRVVLRTVRAAGAGPGAPRLEVRVWLPPQYSQRANRSKRFPVLMFLPGQPSSPKSVLTNFDFPAQASAAIAANKIEPFVAVFPPIMIDPPRDTECTDVPRGPQAESWLYKAVRTDLVNHYRVSKDSASWSVAGFSTGGYCAAKLLLRHPDLFGSAVSIGGYFNALSDDTTGDLWGGDANFRNENAPRYLVEQVAGRPVNLLIVVSKEDQSSYAGKSYADSQQMIAETKDVEGVSSLVLDSGGHNYDTYAPTLPKALTWIGSKW